MEQRCFACDRRTSIVIGSTVFSHWVLDSIVYSTLPVFFGHSQTSCGTFFVVVYKDCSPNNGINTIRYTANEFNTGLQIEICSRNIVFIEGYDFGGIQVIGSSTESGGNERTTLVFFMLSPPFLLWVRAAVVHTGSKGNPRSLWNA